MQIKHRVYNNVLYCILCGELDEHSANFTKETLDSLFDKLNFKQIIIDLSELDFMDSTGVGIMIGRYKKMKPTPPLSFSAPWGEGVLPPKFFPNFQVPTHPGLRYGTQSKA